MQKFSYCMESPYLLSNKFLKFCALLVTYEYFDRHIRPLQKLPNGKVDIHASGLEDNDADAFRHACVSGAYTQSK
jgi:hypothetical protein